MNPDQAMLGRGRVPTKSLPSVVRLVEDGLKRMLAGLAPVRLSGVRRVRAEPLPVVAPIPPSLLRAEIEALPVGQRLVESGQYQIQYARAHQIPWCLQEIGRLRELTFRAAGEGTGETSDIDLFDAYYLHLFLWDRKAGAIVGAYRMGLADEILARYGARGLYTQSLFRYGPQLLQTLNPAIELGRSFIRAEYQRSYSALLLLWRGILQFVQRSPHYAVLFGPVSISNSYAPASRQLIVEYLRANNCEANLARHVKPRRPFRAKVCDEVAIADLKDIEHLSSVIARIEHDSKGVPILLKQYLKLGGRFIGFSTDDQFSDALDGLVVVDLRASEPRVLARYMGEEGTAAFFAYHGALADSLRRVS